MRGQLLHCLLELGEGQGIIWNRLEVIPQMKQLIRYSDATNVVVNEKGFYFIFVRLPQMPESEGIRSGRERGSRDMAHSQGDIPGYASSHISLAQAWMKESLPLPT